MTFGRRQLLIGRGEREVHVAVESADESDASHVRKPYFGWDEIKDWLRGCCRADDYRCHKRFSHSAK
ncbi:hypothetical protein TNCT_164231 [Trichonephila clavata]|uniref:Uncharacterized protein n=1 Tax=Trichonephila clavata TaxID=2740835 RepID=A0A8X6JS35_TRICU|nr:hypothetical protein TNCT_164231 [Trichonephila clavata]